MKRIGIYFFYDHEGVVDRYVTHFLEAMSPSFDQILVVCNGSLTAEGRETFQALPNTSLLVRPNTGFDVWAYRTGLLHLGWDALQAYDELVLMNFTIMGPVNSFDDMFAEMDGRDVDFWGMTVHNGTIVDPWGLMPEGYIPLHLQSHFLAIRRSLFATPEFQNYWIRMGPIRSYHEAIAKHEALFTQRFERMGFRWASYVDTADQKEVGYYPLYNQPVDLIENRLSPVFKRKMFLSSPAAYLDENANQVAHDLFDYLRESGKYDVEYILEHIVRSADIGDIRSSLLLDRVIEPAKVALQPRPRIAVFVEAEAHGLREILSRVQAAVPGAELIVLGSPDDAGAYAGIRMVAVDALGPLATAFELARAFEFAAYCGATESLVTFPQTIELARRDQVLDAMFYDFAFVDGLIAELRANTRVGLVFPPPPIHAGHFGNVAHGWRGQFKPVDEALTVAGITVRRSHDRPMGYPESNSFWFRPTAFEGVEAVLAGLGENEDAVATRTGQLLLLPLIAQSHGYLSHEVMPSAIANNRMTTMRYYLERLGAAWAPGAGEYFREVEHGLASAAQARGVSTGVGLRARMYFDTRHGYTEYESVPVEGYAQIDGSLRFEASIPPGVVSARFDPVDGFACVCSGVSAGNHKIKPINHRRVRGYDVFAVGDPQYQIDGPFPEGDLLVVTVQHLYPVTGAEWMQHLFPTRRHLPSMLARVMRRMGDSARSRQRARTPDDIGLPSPWVDDFE
ncbi:MAG: hypothetical protein JWO10_1067 [Microbacteriaceae bacterium]|nr:hypothetical protein [Microbacteriaceae bacterium]